MTTKCKGLTSAEDLYRRTGQICEHGRTFLDGRTAQRRDCGKCLRADFAACQREAIEAAARVAEAPCDYKKCNGKCRETRALRIRALLDPEPKGQSDD